MKKRCVLVSGESVSKDAELISELKKNAVVLRNADNTKIETLLRTRKVDVIILEVSSKSPGEVDIILHIKAKFMHVKIILIDGEREVVAKAFQYGVSDVYKKPYRNEMVVERVKALLKASSANANND
jgi:DNA-binding NarL/FixJ family response regulator